MSIATVPMHMLNPGRWLLDRYGAMRVAPSSVAFMFLVLHPEGYMYLTVRMLITIQRASAIAFSLDPIIGGALQRREQDVSEV